MRDIAGDRLCKPFFDLMLLTVRPPIGCVELDDNTLAAALFGKSFRDGLFDPLPPAG